MTIKQLLNQAVNRLSGVDDEQEIILDARLLLEYTLDCNRAYMILHENDEIEQQVCEQYFQYIEERVHGKPIEYIMHKAYFYGYEFKVNEYTLIPRPETEELVSYALDKLEIGQRQKIFDVGSGSGCIGIALCKSNENIYCVSIDRSKDAIQIGKYNAKFNGVSDRMSFVESDLFQGIDEDYIGEVDMILSNPPYIRSADIQELSSKVKDYEPMMALDGGQDGLIFYKAISAEAKRYLKKGGWLLFEVGHDQAEEVMNILEEEKYHHITCKKDLFKIDRIVMATI
jgi:release factor glutamine methyltransferase